MNSFLLSVIERAVFLGYALLAAVYSGSGAPSPWWYLLPLSVCGALAYEWYRRHSWGFIPNTIIPQYDVPAGLTPAIAGVVIDGKVTGRDISAEIVLLASEGYLSIKNEHGTHHFINAHRNDVDVLPYHQQSILRALFGGRFDDEVSFRDIQKRFHQYATLVADEVYRAVVYRGYFIDNPTKVRAFFWFIGIMLITVTLYDGVIDVLSPFILAGISVVLFGSLMPARTTEGAEMKRYLLGLKMFIEVTEKDRLREMAGPGKDPALFETLLPYAIVFGVEKKWAAQFEGLYQGMPSWYEAGAIDGIGSVFIGTELGILSSTFHALASGAKDIMTDNTQYE